MTMSSTSTLHLSRRAWLALLALPALSAGCGIQPLPGLRRSALPAGAVLPDVRAPALGQHWTYRLYNVYNSEQIDTLREEITALAPEIVLTRQSARQGTLPSEIQTTWGLLRQDPAWDAVQTYDTPLPIWPQPPALGARQALDTHYRPGNASFRQWIQVHSRVAAAEQVTVSAGVFDTLRIEKLIRLNHQDSSRQQYMRTDTLWFAPAVGRWVAREINGEYLTSGRRPTQVRENHWRWELESWA